jgi:hypothetical protein
MDMAQNRAGETLPAPVLPVAFDTSFAGLAIAKGMAVLQGILLLGLADGLFLSQSVAKVAGIAVCLAFVTGFGVLIFKKLGGATGTITGADVTVVPSTFFILTSDSPAGTFPLADFKGVRIDIIPFSASAGGGPHERVYLAGREGGAPDILVAQTQRGAGVVWGKQLGQLLSLPAEERRTAY